MFTLGIDVGTSSIKVSVFDVNKKRTIASAYYPEQEARIISLRCGYAEQDPIVWWENVKMAILKCHKQGFYDPRKIVAIGIAYQMHGLVITDKNSEVLRHSIIWCDSRAVKIGEVAFKAIGEEICLEKLLNSPANFTASKLSWVKQNEPQLFEKIHKFMLPGDFIAMKLSGALTTTISALSEGIFWDFKTDTVAKEIMVHFGFDQSLVPEIMPVFSTHGHLTQEMAKKLGMEYGIPISYKAGDQPNNALSVNVLQPGEVAATAGTSGVIYGISEQPSSDRLSRVNTFANVNYKPESKKLGVLLCINGAGSLYRWSKASFAPELSYQQINEIAASSKQGSKGLKVLPFGNGSERMLGNRHTNAQFLGIDLNIHGRAEIFRAVQEGVGYAFRYGLDILKENNVNPAVIRAGHSNMFLSEVFTKTFVGSTRVPVELYENDGATGAAIGAAIGAGIYTSTSEAFSENGPKKVILPDLSDSYEQDYQDWKSHLEKALEQQDITQ